MINLVITILFINKVKTICVESRKALCFRKGHSQSVIYIDLVLIVFYVTYRKRENAHLHREAVGARRTIHFFHFCKSSPHPDVPFLLPIDKNRFVHRPWLQMTLSSDEFRSRVVWVDSRRVSEYEKSLLKE